MVDITEHLSESESAGDIAFLRAVEIGNVEQLEYLCRMYGVSFDLRLDTQDTYTAESCVEQGFGVMFYPEITWGKSHNDKNRFLRISDDGFYRDISAYVKKDKANDESILRVRDHLVRSFACK